MTNQPDRGWAEVRVAEVRRSESREFAHVVVLEEPGQGRRLPIFVGASEAHAIACSLESVETPRPMTYQLAANLVAVLDGRVREVRITRLADSTYFASIEVETASGVAPVDSRPSDALNIALVTGAPVLVNKELLDAEALPSDPNWADYPTGAPELAGEVRERQRRFRQWADRRHDAGR